MSIGLTTKNTIERRKLHEDVLMFLKKGGEITHLPYGVAKEDRVSFNNHRPLTFPKK